MVTEVLNDLPIRKQRLDLLRVGKCERMQNKPERFKNGCHRKMISRSEIFDIFLHAHSMSDEIEELKDRITALTDDELIEMVTVGANDYREDALDYARAELRKRGVDYSTVQEKDTEPPASFEPFPTMSGRNPDESVCAICGGQLRAGSLVAEKELTVIFNDNREERFVKVNVCTRCGQLSLVADFETDVGS